MKKEELKSWVKEHKKAILWTGLTIGGTALAIFEAKYVFPRIGTCTKDLGEHVAKSLTGLEKNARLIDEEIFTELAPAIENAVLDEGLEKVVLERAYDLNKEELLSKFVTVTIENVYGD